MIQLPRQTTLIFGASTSFKFTLHLYCCYLFSYLYLYSHCIQLIISPLQSGSLADSNFHSMVSPLLWPEIPFNGNRQQHQQQWNFDALHRPLWGREEDNHTFITMENSLLNYESANSGRLEFSLMGVFTAWYLLKRMSLKWFDNHSVKRFACERLKGDNSILFWYHGDTKMLDYSNEKHKTIIQIIGPLFNILEHVLCSKKQLLVTYLI